MLAANIFAAAQDNDPHNSHQNKGVPSLQRLALQTIIKMEREQGVRLAPGQIPLLLEHALERERLLLQAGAFQIVAHKPGFGALGKFLEPIQKDGKTYLYVYIHPDKLHNVISVGQQLVCDSLIVKTSAVNTMVSALRHDWVRGPVDPLPTGENTLLALHSTVLPQ